MPDSELSGIRKAAIFVLSLEQGIASEILKQLDESQIEELSREIAGLGPVTQQTRDEVVGEFYQLALARSYADEGGWDYAKSLLARSLPAEKANKIIDQVNQAIQSAPFSFLQKAESENLLTFIQDEHPQTIALILAHLKPTQASEILRGLPGQKQVEVVKRIANMEQTNPEVIKEVERGLEHRLSAMISQTFEKAGGIDTVAEMLNLADRATDKGIQSMLKEVDNDDLALALKTASQELKDKIFKNMSERASQLIKEDMEYMGPVRVSDVEAAQQKIVDVVRRLEESGEIIVSGRGGEKDLVV